MTVVLTDDDLSRLERAFPYLAFERLTQTIQTDFADLGDHYLSFGPKGVGKSRRTHRDRRGHFLPSDAMRAENAQEAIATQLMERFPALYISANLDTEGIALAVWVKRGDRDGTSVGGLRLTDTGAEATLAHWQEEVERAQQDGWFFCTGHVRAEETDEGRWSHFAGTYGWLYKIEREYKNLGTLLTKMRRGETEVGMDWDLIIDAGRETRVASTWSSPRAIVDAVTKEYRRDIWSTQPAAVYLGVEKEALAVIFRSIADEYAVPVVVAKGYPSATYQHDLETEFYESARPVHFFYYGDHDPSGDGIADLFEDLVLMSDNYSAGHTFIRSALTAQQIIDRGYLTRPPKASDSRTANWDDGGAEAADVDAIPPDELREIIRADIESIIDTNLLAATLEQQEEDLAKLKKMAKAL